MTRIFHVAVVLSLAGAIGGCMVGPDFHPPQPPAVTNYPSAPLPDHTASGDAAGAEAQRLVAGRDIPAEWWTLFQSPALDVLVRQALTDSPKLAQAQAKLVRARADFDSRQGATKYPAIDAAGSINAVGVQGDTVKPGPLAAVDFPLTLSLASVSVSYTLDLFGRTRRELEALHAAVDFERFQVEASRLMLAGNVVTTAIEEAALRQQIAATEESIDLVTRQLHIVERLEQIGAVATRDTVTQRGELAATRATLPALQQRLEQARHRLAVYLGQPPATAQLPAFRLTDLRLPGELPVSLPSDLARQRPDIRAAEALLHEASARVGVATANFYPRITLSGQGGAVAVAPLLSGVAGFALLGASIAQPLFHGNELKGQKRAAVAAFDQAGAAYHDVVLSGLQNVADILVALDADARALRERTAAATLADTAYEITSHQYEAGGVSLLELLEAQRRRVSASTEVTRSIAARFTDSAALFQALGGGWWTVPPANTTAPPPAPPKR